jgi:hypothetical protein
MLPARDASLAAPEAYVDALDRQVWPAPPKMRQGGSDCCGHCADVVTRIGGDRGTENDVAALLDARNSQYDAARLDTPQAPL